MSLFSCTMYERQPESRRARPNVPGRECIPGYEGFKFRFTVPGYRWHGKRGVSGRLGIPTSSTSTTRARVALIRAGSDGPSPGTTS
eukprot:2896852-Rhodomonas_salina.4